MAAIPAVVVFFIFRFIAPQERSADCTNLAEEEASRDAFGDADATMLIALFSPFPGYYLVAGISPNLPK